jgi:hypothetical protein
LAVQNIISATDDLPIRKMGGVCKKETRLELNDRTYDEISRTTTNSRAGFGTVTN